MTLEICNYNYVTNIKIIKKYPLAQFTLEKFISNFLGEKYIIILNFFKKYSIFFNSK